MKPKFILGPLQEKWLKALEQNPEQQITGQLGYIKEDGSKGYCCLGNGAEICGVLEWGGMYVAENGGEFKVFYDYNLLGLHGSCGELLKPVKRKGKKFNDLAEMNDNGWTWPEIAAYIRENPENVFVESK